ncbi:MAG: hypothetical protein PVF45_03660, partial [Anaerolineae bacterium]
MSSRALAFLNSLTILALLVNMLPAPRTAQAAPIQAVAGVTVAEKLNAPAPVWPETRRARRMTWNLRSEAWLPVFLLGPDESLLTGPISQTPAPGPAAQVTLRLGKRRLTADGRDRTRLVVLVTDEAGRPVADGTPVRLHARGGQVRPLVAQTRDGLVFGRLRAGDQAGIGQVVAETGDLADEVSFELLAPPAGEIRLDDENGTVTEGSLPFELSEVVERARNTIQTPARGLPFVERGGHRALFDAGRLHFAPLDRPLTTTLDLETPLTLTVELAGVYVGEEALFEGPAPAQAQLEGNVARFERGQGMVEELVARDAGVEQRWWLTGDPGLEGDLLIVVEVETALALAPDARGRGFVLRAVDEERGASRPVARYGRALALDAAGRAKRARLRFREIRPLQPGQRRYRLVMRFPARWLAGASYPLLIDPLISGLLRLDAAFTQAETQSQPAAAYNDTHDEYLVVWQDNRDGDVDVYGQFVLPGGLLSGGNFTITAASGNQATPDVAYNPDQDAYLVVWDDGDGAAIKGRIVDASGNLSPTLELAPLTLGDLGEPAVAYSAAAGYWLVTWQYGLLDDYALYARAVDGAGTMRDAFSVSNNDSKPVLPDVAANADGGFVVAWKYEGAYGQYDYIYARRVEATGVDGASFSIDGTPELGSGPGVTYNADDDEYLVAWEDRATTYDTVKGRQIRGTYDPGGEFVGDAFQISDAQADCGAPDVTYFAPQGANDGVYLVAWEQQNGSQTDLMARRVLTGGTPSGTVISLSVASGDQADVALAFGPVITETLAAWTDARAGNADIYARRVAPDG